MNGAMLLQHAAGVIEHRERIYGPPLVFSPDTMATMSKGVAFGR